ncbi:MAG: DUF885 domain-containing protein [Pseudomonadota bacterium]
MRSLILFLTLVAAPLHADTLDTIIEDYWSYYLAEFPLAATRAGLKSGNDRLARVDPNSQARRLQAERAFLDRLSQLDAEDWDNNDRINAELLQWILEDSIGAYELDLSRIPFNTFSGFFMAALSTSSGVAMTEVSDYEDYIARLNDIPRYFDENLANMRRGMRDGFVLPQIVIDGVLPTIRAQLKERAEDSRFFTPFEAINNRIPAGDRESIRARGRQAIESSVMPAFAAVAEFLANEYAASETLGAEMLPDGEAFYAHQIRRYTTLTGISSDEIHAIGLAEVARIRAEMAALIERVEFDGEFRDFIQFMRTDPRFYATSAEQLLMATAWTAKRIDHVMPGYFKTLPRQSYGVVPVPDEIAPNYTTGAYRSAPPGGSKGGEYWVNTFALDQRPLYEIPALTLHEAVPGHHHQSALSLEIPGAPEFRKSLYFSAFGEGWALYAEFLGEEMGIYRDDYERFGRLSYEMWRASRLVIDTGLHAKGWSREQAQAFLADNTSLSEGNIRAEVDRYISWPGQALSYKLGEIKIRELRAYAEETLGNRFDIREFHDALLVNGAMPLAMLERQILRFVERELDSPDS